MLLDGQPVIPVLKIERAADAVPLARALTRGGLKAIRQDQVTQIEQAEADLLGRVQRIRHDRDHSYVVRVLAMQYEAKARVVHEGLRARKRRLAG